MTKLFMCKHDIQHFPMKIKLPTIALRTYATKRLQSLQKPITQHQTNPKIIPAHEKINQSFLKVFRNQPNKHVKGIVHNADDTTVSISMLSKYIQGIHSIRWRLQRLIFANVTIKKLRVSPVDSNKCTPSRTRRGLLILRRPDRNRPKILTLLLQIIYPPFGQN